MLHSKIETNVHMLHELYGLFDSLLKEIKQAYHSYDLITFFVTNTTQVNTNHVSSAFLFGKNNSRNNS